MTLAHAVVRSLAVASLLAVSACGDDAADDPAPPTSPAGGSAVENVGSSPSTSLDPQTTAAPNPDAGGSGGSAGATAPDATG